MIRRAVAWLRAEIATPTVGQLADRLELAEGAAARDAAQIEALTERLRIAEDRGFDEARIEALEAQAREQAGSAYKARADLNDALAANAALVEQLAEACRERDVALSDERNAESGREAAWAMIDAKDAALRTIATLGAASRNGTARKLARLAREALE